MSSVRLEPELEARVREAAHRLGRSPSEVYRRALRELCDATLATGSGSRYRDVIGIGTAPADLAQRADELFAAALEERTRGAADPDGHPG